MPDVQRFLDELAAWAAQRGDVVGVALVGSYARGTAGPDSDVDVVILAEDPERLLSDATWVGRFGEAGEPEREDYGVVQSLRVTYGDGLEVEFGITSPKWADTETLDRGTREVVEGGCRVVFDRDGALAALVRQVSDSG